MQIALKALGCRLNEAELESWSNDFQRLGHCVTSNAETADIVVVNSCAVTQEAVKKSRQLIRKIHRNNPRAKLVVSGCYASLNPELKNEIDSIDLLVGNREKDTLAQIVNDELITTAMPMLATAAGETSLFARGRNRAFIKVQDGCRYSCTFCIVTKTRGSERSKKLCDVINEINQIQKQGIKEVILTGVHIGGYGSDINTNLVSLIRAILKETDIPRIRLGSVEPWDLDFDFINLFSNPRLMPHLHLPLQSGSDTVLRRMARRCKTENFAKLLTRLHACVPNFNITTDVIVGFPGESDNEWLESLAYIKSCNFSHIHIFPYSQRHGTLAANMPNQIAPALKKARIQELNSLAVEMRKSALEKYSGLETLVLIENQMGTTTNGKQAYLGYTPNYIKVRLISDCELPFKNEIIKVRLDGYDRQSSLMNGILANPVKSLQNLA